jgi:hypothetical protein
LIRFAPTLWKGQSVHDLIRRFALALPNVAFFGPLGHYLAARANVGVQGDGGSRRRSRQTTLLTQTRHQQTNPFEKAKLRQPGS